MLKIIKYEFRKNRLSLAIMLGIAAGLYALAPLGKLLDKGELMLISVFLLFTYAFAAYVYVLVRGITAYSGELRGRSGYLLMLVPRSTMSILFGKLLFTLVMGLLMLAVSAFALSAAWMVLFEDSLDLASIIATARFMLLQEGITPGMITSTVLFFTAAILTSVLVVVAVGYLAVTLSATVLQGGKLRGLLSFVLFAVLIGLTARLQGLVTPEAVLYGTYEEAVRAAMPVLMIDLALTCAFTALSAVLLKKKVSL